jgi:hypothetical protein
VLKAWWVTLQEVLQQQLQRPAQVGGAGGMYCITQLAALAHQCLPATMLIMFMQQWPYPCVPDDLSTAGRCALTVVPHPVDSANYAMRAACVTPLFSMCCYELRGADRS